MFSRQSIIFISIIFIIIINTIVLIISAKNFLSFKSSQSFAVSSISFIEKHINKSLLYVRNGFKNYFMLVETEKENKQLRQQLYDKEQELNFCKEALRKNSRVKNLLLFQTISQLETEVANVISRDFSSWFNTVTISKGSKNGIKKNMPVIVKKGVVGKIIEVYPNYSKVLLITDKNSAVSVVDQESRTNCIAVGNNFNSCKLKYAPADYKLKKGNTIITSGFDNVYPKGLKIGYISEIKEDKNDVFFQDIVMKTYVDFNLLEEVMVVLKTP